MRTAPVSHLSQPSHGRAVPSSGHRAKEVIPVNRARTIGLTLVAAAVIAAVLVGAALGAGSGSAKKSNHARAAAVRAVSTPDSGKADSSNEQSGESESSTDSEQGQAGEPAQGHQDPPGDVNHECTGDCQE